MPIATLPSLPQPATKMEDRKRPASSAVDDAAPPSKRQAVNGSKSKDDVGDSREETWIEVSSIRPPLSPPQTSCLAPIESACFDSAPSLFAVAHTIDCALCPVSQHQHGVFAGVFALTVANARPAGDSRPGSQAFLSFPYPQIAYRYLAPHPPRCTQNLSYHGPWAEDLADPDWRV